MGYANERATEYRKRERKVKKMNCITTIELQQEWESLQAKINIKRTPELTKREDELSKEILDHKMVHNSGWMESSCRPA